MASTPRSAQGRWIVRELAALVWRDAAWWVLVVHQPPWSRSWAGYDGDERVRRWVRFLAGRGLDLVIAGHSHAYERARAHGGHAAVGRRSSPGRRWGGALEDAVRELPRRRWVTASSCAITTAGRGRAGHGRVVGGRASHGRVFDRVALPRRSRTRAAGFDVDATPRSRRSWWLPRMPSTCVHAMAHFIGKSTSMNRTPVVAALAVLLAAPLLSAGDGREHVAHCPAPLVLGHRALTLAICPSTRWCLYAVAIEQGGGLHRARPGLHEGRRAPAARLTKWTSPAWTRRGPSSRVRLAPDDQDHRRHHEHRLVRRRFHAGRASAPARRAAAGVPGAPAHNGLYKIPTFAEVIELAQAAPRREGSRRRGVSGDEAPDVSPVGRPPARAQGRERPAALRRTSLVGAGCSSSRSRSPTSSS